MSCVEVANNAGSSTVSMSSKLQRPLLEWMCDHQVMGRIVCPGAAYMEMSGSVSEICNGTMGTELHSLVLNASIPMPLTLAKPNEKQTGLDADCVLSLVLDIERGEVQVRSSTPSQGGTGLHLRAVLGLKLNKDGLSSTTGLDDKDSVCASPDVVRAECSQCVDTTAMYASLHSVGLQYGPSFQVVSRVNVVDDGKRVFGCLSGSSCADESGFAVSPAILDGCMHLGVGLRHDQSDAESSSDAKVPAGFSAYCNLTRLSAQNAFGIAERGKTQPSGTGAAKVSSHYILDASGSIASKLQDLLAKSIKPSMKEVPVEEKLKNVYAMSWQSSIMKPSSVPTTTFVSQSYLYM